MRTISVQRHHLGGTAETPEAVTRALLALQHHVFDNRGNIGPTLWWDGEIIGSRAAARAGEIRTAILADRGAEARAAVQRAAKRLQERLDGAVINPRFARPWNDHSRKTPLNQPQNRDVTVWSIPGKPQVSGTPCCARVLAREWQCRYTCPPSADDCDAAAHYRHRPLA